MTLDSIRGSAIRRCPPRRLGESISVIASPRFEPATASPDECLSRFDLSITSPRVGHRGSPERGDMGVAEKRAGRGFREETQAGLRGRRRAPDAEAVLAPLSGWIDDYNTRAPHSALGSPAEYRAKATLNSSRGAVLWGALHRRDITSHCQTHSRPALG